ncbi:Streptomycin adenylyltransferase [Halolactibacillus halophilus]|uniref:Streptomycin adenylyltransferase n=1 Tax=Halolactibacillus halophilus TaxID=306540 RepID=A0A1I5T8Y9_9BACI|nr:hypothetical protein HHA03_24680 [Halolactibacillus halophilus]SFP79418.1 Streptomycin adenylyltransferase [Halolactibacillus halophilus]
MQSEQAMYDLILSVAKEDTRIRSVLLNGSRAKKKMSYRTMILFISLNTSLTSTTA